MSALSDYTPEQVEKMMAAPMLVSMYVMGSSLSGPVGLVKEMMAGVDTSLAAARSSAPNSVLVELFSEENMKTMQAKVQRETSDTTQGSENMEQAKVKMLDEVKQSLAILSTKGSPDEIAAYKKLMVDVAVNVANAAKEGGFAGMGGKLVNDAEKTAIRDVQQAVA